MSILKTDKGLMSVLPRAQKKFAWKEEGEVLVIVYGNERFKGSGNAGRVNYP